MLQAAAEEVDENFPGGIDYLINMAGESNTVLLPLCARDLAFVQKVTHLFELGRWGVMQGCAVCQQCSEQVHCIRVAMVDS